MEMIGNRKVASIMKCCELVGVSRRTIYNWLDTGRLEYVRTAGGAVRIYVDTLFRSPSGKALSEAPGDLTVVAPPKLPRAYYRRS